MILIHLHPNLIAICTKDIYLHCCESPSSNTRQVLTKKQAFVIQFPCDPYDMHQVYNLHPTLDTVCIEHICLIIYSKRIYIVRTRQGLLIGDSLLMLIKTL